MFYDLREKKRHFIFGQTLFVSGQKVHLDSEKRNLKLGLRAEVKLTTFVRKKTVRQKTLFGVKISQKGVDKHNSDRQKS